MAPRSRVAPVEDDDGTDPLDSFAAPPAHVEQLPIFVFNGKPLTRPCATITVMRRVRGDFQLIKGPWYPRDIGTIEQFEEKFGPGTWRVTAHDDRGLMIMREELSIAGVPRDEERAAAARAGFAAPANDSGALAKPNPFAGMDPMMLFIFQTMQENRARDDARNERDQQRQLDQERLRAESDRAHQATMMQLFTTIISSGKASGGGLTIADLAGVKDLFGKSGGGTIETVTQTVDMLKALGLKVGNTETDDLSTEKILEAIGAFGASFMGVRASMADAEGKKAEAERAQAEAAKRSLELEAAKRAGTGGDGAA